MGLVSYECFSPVNTRNHESQVSKILFLLSSSAPLNNRIILWKILCKCNVCNLDCEKLFSPFFHRYSTVVLTLSSGPCISWYLCMSLYRKSALTPHPSSDLLQQLRTLWIWAGYHSIIYFFFKLALYSLSGISGNYMKVFFNFNKHSQGHFPVGRNWGKAGVLGIKYQAVVARLAVSLCCLGRRAFSVAQPWTTSEWSRVLPQWLGSKSLALAPLAWKVPVIFVTAFFLMLSCTFYDAILNLSWSRLFFFLLLSEMRRTGLTSE